MSSTRVAVIAISSILVVLIVYGTSLWFSYTPQTSTDDSALAAAAQKIEKQQQKDKDKQYRHGASSRVIASAAKTRQHARERCKHPPLWDRDVVVVAGRSSSNPLSEDDGGGTACTLRQEEFIIHRFSQLAFWQRSKSPGIKKRTKQGKPNLHASIAVVGQGLGVGYSAISIARSMGLAVPSASRFGFALDAFEHARNLSSASPAAAGILYSAQQRSALCDGNSGCACECLVTPDPPSESIGAVDDTAVGGAPAANRQQRPKWMSAVPEIQPDSMRIFGFDGQSKATAKFTQEYLQRVLFEQQEQLLDGTSETRSPNNKKNKNSSTAVNIRFAVASNITDEKVPIAASISNPFVATTNNNNNSNVKPTAWAVALEEEIGNFPFSSLDLLSVSSSALTHSADKDDDHDAGHWSRVIDGSKKLLRTGQVSMVLIRSTKINSNTIEKEQRALSAALEDFARWRYLCFFVPSLLSASDRLMVPINGDCADASYARMIASAAASWTVFCHHRDFVGGGDADLIARMRRRKSTMTPPNDNKKQRPRRQRRRNPSLKEEEEEEEEEPQQQQQQQQQQQPTNEAVACPSSDIGSRLFRLLAVEKRAEALSEWISAE